MLHLMSMALRHRVPSARQGLVMGSWKSSIHAPDNISIVRAKLSPLLICLLSHKLLVWGMRIILLDITPLHVQLAVPQYADDGSSSLAPGVLQLVLPSVRRNQLIPILPLLINFKGFV